MVQINQIVEIPEPIGDYFFHRHYNGTVQHHESPWRKGFTHCKECGLSAQVSIKPLDKFLKDDDLMEQLCRSGSNLGAF